MRIDLHNHTHFCNHASGTQEQYILRAMDLGIDVFGFSEHAPMSNFNDGYRISVENLPKYVSETKRLQEKYSNNIEILLGYEVDFIKNSLILDEIKDAKVDYLIGSCHYLDNWGFDNPEYIGEYKNRDITKIWEEYFCAVKDMASSKLFDIVGHLDLIKIFDFMPKKDIRLIAKDAISEIKRANMVVEINSAGCRKPIKEQYPSLELLKMCYEKDIQITFSSDAHSVEQVGLNYEKVKEMAKSVGYTKCVTFKARDRKVVDF